MTDKKFKITDRMIEEMSSSRDLLQTEESIINNKIDRFGKKIILDLNISDIDDRSEQVRKNYDEEKIDALAQDIKEKGLIHPITVSNFEKGSKKFILRIGWNRIKAFKKLGLNKIPCIVNNDLGNPVQILLYQLSENMKRSDISPIEVAESLMKLKNEADYTLDQLAKSIGKSIDMVKKYSRINNLSNEQKDYHVKNKSSVVEILNSLSEISKNNAPLQNEGAEIKRPSKYMLTPYITNSEKFIKLSGRKISLDGSRKIKIKEIDNLINEMEQALIILRTKKETLLT